MTGMVQAFGFSVSGLLVTFVNYSYYILLGAILLSILVNYLAIFLPANGVVLGLYEVVGALANPILAPLRSRIPPLRLGSFALDLSPIIAIILLSVARSLLLLFIANFIQPVTG